MMPSCKIARLLTSLAEFVHSKDIDGSFEFEQLAKLAISTRSSSGEACFSVVYFRGTLPQKRGENGQYWGTHFNINLEASWTERSAPRLCVDCTCLNLKTASDLGSSERPAFLAAQKEVYEMTSKHMRFAWGTATRCVQRT